MTGFVFVLAVLAAGLALYAVLGGADFGAGLYELVRGDRHAPRVTAALSPVWEVNHVWIILVVVVCFNVFPGLYAFWSIELHVPVMIALLGVVARGTAFTFRHYDPVRASPMARLYTVTFRVASVFTPFMLGIVFGALFEGGLGAAEGASFAARFIAPWSTPFCFAMGVATTLATLHVASVFLLVDGAAVDAAADRRFARRVHALTLVAAAVAVGIGALTDAAIVEALKAGRPVLWILAAALGALAVDVAVLQSWRAARYFVAIEMAAAVLAPFAMAFPAAHFAAGGDGGPVAHTWASYLAGPVPDALLIALGVGLCAVMPLVAALFWVFKSERALPPT